MNGLMCSGLPPTELGNFTPQIPQSAVVRTLTAVKDAANKIMVFEEDRRTIDDGYGLLVPHRQDTNTLSLRHDGFDEGQSPAAAGARDSNDVSINQGATPTVAVLKNGDRLGNVAFCDGHAAAIDRVSAHSKDHWAPDPILLGQQAQQAYP
jgi:prepilin-type processing-associated H-X9-DG protein